MYSLKIGSKIHNLDLRIWGVKMGISIGMAIAAWLFEKECEQIDREEEEKEYWKQKCFHYALVHNMRYSEVLRALDNKELTWEQVEKGN